MSLSVVQRRQHPTDSPSYLPPPPFSLIGNLQDASYAGGIFMKTLRTEVPIFLSSCVSRYKIDIMQMLYEDENAILLCMIENF